MMTMANHLLLLAGVVLSPVAAIKLWETPGDISSSVPAGCRVALTQNITCDLLVTPNQAQNEMSLPDAAVDLYCADTCRDSVASFQKRVSDSCGHKLYVFEKEGSMERSAQQMAEGFTWAQNLMCIQEGDNYCLQSFYNGTVERCSECLLNYGAVMQQSDYGRSKFPEKMFKQMLEDCDANPDDYPYEYTPGPPAPTTTDDGTPEPTPTPFCENGKKITAKEGDDCDSLALANLMSSSRFRMVNKLDQGCTDLKSGRELCVKDTCKLATIKEGQTCDDFVEGKQFSIVQLQSWNPELKNKCNPKANPNLDTFAGQHICIEPPGGSPFPTSTEPEHSPKPTLPSSMFTETWGKGSVETSPTRGPITIPTGIMDPTYTPPPQTITVDPEEQAEYEEWTQWCWITAEDWQRGFEVDDLTPACQDFYQKYCVYYPDSDKPSPTPMTRFPAMCTPDRTEEEIPVETPDPIQNGVPENCNKWHYVEKGELCPDIAKTNDIKLEDFYKWNPAVGSECRGLWADVYVCVGVNAAEAKLALYASD